MPAGAEKSFRRSESAAEVFLETAVRRRLRSRLSRLLPNLPEEREMPLRSRALQNLFAAVGAEKSFRRSESGAEVFSGERVSRRVAHQIVPSSPQTPEGEGVPHRSRALQDSSCQPKRRRVSGDPNLPPKFFRERGVRGRLTLQIVAFFTPTSRRRGPCRTDAGRFYFSSTSSPTWISREASVKRAIAQRSPTTRTAASPR